MKSMKRNIGITAIMLWIVMLSGTAFADENKIAINSAMLIHSPDNSDFRVLMRPQIKFPDTTMVIDRAFLNLIASPQTDDATYISIRLHPITTDWDGNNVSWDSPWTEAGGDIDEMFYGEHLIILPEDQDIQIDITDLCMRWADGRLPYYGFLLRVSGSSLSHFTVVRQTDSGPWAAVSIQYTPISPHTPIPSH